jgi:hypothetical protein
LIKGATRRLATRAFDTLKHDSSSLHWQQVASGTQRR